MPINKDLFLAILSMDSYNRGYNRGIKFSIEESQADRDEVGAHIGNATILSDSIGKLGPNAKSAGFYALTYNVSPTGIAGLSGTVVAYRGSDNFTEQDGVAGDLPAYTIALTGSLTSDQARLSIEFYRAVAGTNLTDNGITITGHSLGAGLGGMVAGIYNRPLFALDPMQFGNAVNNAWSKLDPDSPDYDTQFVSLVTGGASVNWTREQASYFAAVAIRHEARLGYLQSNRLDLFRRYSQAVSPTGVDIRDLSFDQPVIAGATGRNRVGQLHSNSLIVMKLFSEGLDSQDWQYVKFLIPSLFNEDTGEAAGGLHIDGSDGNDMSGAMRDAIAYSALGSGEENEGEKPFGDTAIYSLFDDANSYRVVVC